MAVCRNAMVNEVWDPSLGQGGWNLRLSRDSNDWELVLIEELLLLLRDFRISSEEDSVLWKGGGLDIFRIRELIICWQPPIPLSFRKRAFGWIRFQPKLLSLHGRLLGKKSSRWIGCKSEGGSSLIVVFCVVVKRKMQITFFYIVQWSGSSGRSSLPCLGLSGCSQRQSKRCYLLEGPFMGKRGKRFGIPSRCVYFRRFGRKEIG